MIDPDHAKMTAVQQAYLRTLLPRVQDLGPTLKNIAITIDDGYQHPPWPALGSAQGKRLVRHIAANLRSHVDELVALSLPPKTFSRQWTFEDSGLRVGMLAVRGRPISGSLPKGIDIRFSGSFPTNVPAANALLANAIDRKIEKRYTSYPAGPLWLLAYSDSHWVLDEASIGNARDLLREKPNPFGAVWTFVPRPHEQAGELVQVFP